MANETPANPFKRQSHVYDFKELQDEAIKKQLASDAAWAADLITKLTTSSGDDAMRPGIVNACEGLAFVRAAKGGLGLTVARGSGFAIRKLDQDLFGGSRWSAPVYFTVTQLGLGVAVGYESVESCLALMTTGSALRFCGEVVGMGTDLGLVSSEGAGSGVPAGTFGRTNIMDVQVDNTSSIFAYSLTHGLLANVSIHGIQTQPNKELNDRLYGDIPLTDVMYGKVPTFPEMLPLYRQIVDTGRKALA